MATIDINKINRSEISRNTGVDLAHISRIFSKKARPSLTLALKIADVLNVSVEELCNALDITPEVLSDSDNGPQPAPVK